MTSVCTTKAFFLSAESTGEIFGRIAVECFADGWASWILHKPEEAPRAKFHGTICSHDSHAVNRLTVKHVRNQLPEDCVMLPSYCNQHHVGRAASDVTTRLNLLSRVWTLTKTFADCDFHVQRFGEAQKSR